MQILAIFLAIFLASLMLYIIYILLLPFIYIWKNMWQHPEQTAKQVITIIGGIMFVIYFKVPFAFELIGKFSKFTFDITFGWLGYIIMHGGSSLATLAFFAIYLAIIISAIILIMTTFSFMRAKPDKFILRMGLGFFGALWSYLLTGSVALEFTVYGIGALIMLFCAKLIW